MKLAKDILFDAGSDGGKNLLRFLNLLIQLLLALKLKQVRF